jgi:osmotically-inducible protein OsmY
LRRLFVLLVLVGILVGAYYWKTGSLVWNRDSLSRLIKVPNLKVPDLGGVGNAFGDATLSARVRTALSLNRNLQPYTFETDVNHGVVTLHGTVRTGEVRNLAGEVVARVPNVTQVVNEVRVDPAAKAQPEADRSLGENLDDRAIEMQVKLALSLEKDLAGSQVTVTVYKKEVTLSGTATSPQRALAVETARQAPGVSKVTDGFANGGVDLDKAKGTIEKALASNSNLAPYHVQVLPRGDHLALVGRVRTGAERDLAGLLAERATTARIENSLELKP